MHVVPAARLSKAGGLGFHWKHSSCILREGPSPVNPVERPKIGLDPRSGPEPFAGNHTEMPNICTDVHRPAHRGAPAPDVPRQGPLSLLGWGCECRL